MDSNFNKNNEKIDFDSIRASFNLKNQQNFEFYCQNMFPDLSSYDKGKCLGVSKVKFFDFIKLPIFICEKLFGLMDKNKDNYLSQDEFIKPLSQLYFGTFEETGEFIFKVYDFDRDNLINPADVKMILSYLPLKTDKTITEYKYQMDSLTELDEIVKSTFQNKRIFTIEDYIEAIQVKSDIYLQLLCYLYQRCPFKQKNITIMNKSSNSSLKGFSNVGKEKENSNSNPSTPKKSPTPKRNSITGVVLNSPSSNTRLSPAGEFLKNAGSFKLDEEDKPKPRKYDSFSNINSVEMSGMKGMIRHTHGGGGEGDGCIKTKSSFNSPTSFLKNQKYKEYADLNNQNSHNLNSSTKFDKTEQMGESSSESENDPVEANTQVIENEEEEKDILQPKDIIYESQILKWSKKANKVVSIFMSIIGEDIYYYEDETKTEMKHVHNISGCFIKENGEEKVGDDKYFSFTVLWVNKSRNYLLKERTIAKEWTKNLRLAIGYKNFFDFYEMLDDIGEGQFGLVKLGVHIKTQEKVAIKIIKKSKMKPNEVGLIKNEIDVLRVCRHPCIVQFLDHFENSEYIFIVMEYIKYGHLREYLKKKKFVITEKRAAKISFQVAGALKYLHSFGVIHRDLKPDNIMVYDNGTNFRVKVMDFGLSKILGPKERAVEGYGTLCFVAPEIIMRDPYNNSIDIWSLGIMIYYILSGELPFDDPTNNEKAIAKKIVYEELAFPDVKWKSKSKEVKNFISLCLIKDMKKRITIEKLAEHEWFIAVEKIEEKEI